MELVPRNEGQGHRHQAAAAQTLQGPACDQHPQPVGGGGHDGPGGEGHQAAHKYGAPADCS